MRFVACKGWHGIAAIPSILFSGCRRYSLSIYRVLLFKDPTSGFILDPPTIPDRCVAGERGGIASQLWVVGCNPLLDPWILFKGLRVISRWPKRGDGSDNACRGNCCSQSPPPRGLGHIVRFVARKGWRGTAATHPSLFPHCRRYSL